MKTQLQAMRKRAGFKSAKAFAEHIGMAVGTYTDYEQGRRMFTLEKACEFARELDCTLDELAGRVPPQTAQETAYDARQASLNDYYESISDESKAALTETARIMSGRNE